MKRESEERPLPALWTVVRTQVETVGLARRRTLIAVGALLTLLFVSEVYVILVRGVTQFDPLLLLGGPVRGIGWAGFIAIAAVFWALFVWHQETPSRRLYHWSLPVERGRHDRVRVFAGAVWLVAGVATFLLGTIAAAFITGNGGGIGELPGTLWPSYLTGAVTFYLLAAVPAVRSEHPTAWVVGVFLAVMLGPQTLDGLFAMDGRLMEAWRGFLTGPIGLSTALGGGITRGAWGEPGAGVWFGPMLVWLAIGVAGVYAATWHSRDA